jgi:N-acetylmuramoyl-L-alanine amidase
MDAPPFIANGRILVPVRYLANALGARTDWDADTRTVAVSTSVYNIQIVIGSTALTVNGQAQAMDQAPVIKDGRTYLPARYVAEALGYDVSWDASSRTVTVSQGN